MKIIDIDTWDRKKLFLFYKDFDEPRYSLSFKQDVTKAYDFCKKNQISFFGFCLYAFLKANNTVPAFRLRLIDDQVIDLEQLGASTAIMKEGDELFSSIIVPFVPTLKEFLPILAKRQAEAAIQKNIPPNSDKQKEKALVSLTCVPWFHYESATFPFLRYRQVMPLMGWCQFKKEGDRLMMPFALQLNHMFIDGFHVSQFIQALDSFFQNPTEL